jgi:hypothetical protein
MSPTDRFDRCTFSNGTANNIPFGLKREGERVREVREVRGGERG